MTNKESQVGPSDEIRTTVIEFAIYQERTRKLNRAGGSRRGGQVLPCKIEVSLRRGID